MDPKKTEIRMNMTPMIDVVFQLIIFFMLVTEMSQAELESLNLPEASMALPDDPELGRITVNILPPEAEGICRIKVRGREMNLGQLRQYLKIEASLDRDPARPALSNRPLMIRADKTAPFRYTQAVMQECVRTGVGIWKVQIATTQGPEGK
ncbi:MAG: ExbD/TolR family protein [Planctomycetota bacterium]|jgi:biopolymer transport protein ExbD